MVQIRFHDLGLNGHYLVIHTLFICWHDGNSVQCCMLEVTTLDWKAMMDLLIESFNVVWLPQNISI